MRPAHAYLGIGIVFILSLIAFIDPQLLMRKTGTSGSMATGVKGNKTMSDNLKLSSPAFGEEASIPSMYTCDSSESSPPLSISGAPTSTKTFVLFMEDPDVPKQLKPEGTFLHWNLFNIPGGVTELIENVKVGISGANGAGKTGYVGPCPPAQYEPSEHRYIFTLYALDVELPLKVGASKSEVMTAIEGHVLSQAQLIGKYKKK